MKYNFTLENIKKDLITNKIVTHIFVFVIGFISALLFTQFGTSEEDTKLIEARLVQKCQAHFKAEIPGTGQDENALDCYKEVLKTYPSNAEALAGLEKIEARYVIWIEGFLERELLDKAELYLKKLLLLNPLSPKVAELETQLRQQRLVAPLLLKCQAHLDDNRLTTGWRGNALSCYRDVLIKDPNNANALAGLEKIEERYATLIKQKLDKGDLDDAEKYLARLRKVNPNYPKLVELETRIMQQVFGPDVSLEIGRLLLECQTYLNEDSLTRGLRGNALSCYRDVLRKYPNNAYALAGIEKIEERYATLIKQKLDCGQLDDSKKYFARLRHLNPNSPKLAGLEVLKEDLAMLCRLNPNSPKLVELETHFLELIEQMLERGQLDEATEYLTKKYLTMLHQINPKSPKLVDLVVRFLELIKEMILISESEQIMQMEASQYWYWLESLNLNSPKLEELIMWFGVTSGIAH